MPAVTAHTYDAAGNVIGTAERAWGFAGKREWEQAFVDLETKRIQGQHFEQFRGAQATSKER